MEWFGRSPISYTHNAQPLELTLKDGSTTDLLKLAEASTPPCSLNPLYFNGHVQTAIAGTSRDAPRIWYKRYIFDSTTPNIPGTFAVDWAVEANTEPKDASLPPRTTYWTGDEVESMRASDEKPTLIVMHGLSGGSHEAYLRHAIGPLVESGKWEVIVINSRGCAWHKITTGIFYNARATWDLRQFVNWYVERYPSRPLFGIGFSLGANILTNYLGEEGEDCRFKGAVLCSNPFNLEMSNAAINRTWIGREVYMKTMGTSMKKLAYRHKEAIQTMTDWDYEKLMKINYLGEFDSEVQPKAWGYPTSSAYYRDASSSDSISAIRIPTIAIHAKDDPIAADEAMPYPEIAANPYTVMVATTLGGHLGWFETGGSRWFTKPVVNFFTSMAFDVDLEKLSTRGVLEPTKREYKYDPCNRKWANKPADSA